MPELLSVFPLYALACARITGYITQDELFGTPRRWLVDWFVRRGGEESLRAYLLICQWCMSTTVAAGVAALWYWHGTNPAALVPMAMFAMSQLTGMMSKLGR